MMYPLLVWISYFACISSIVHAQSGIERATSTVSHGSTDDDWRTWGNELSLRLEPSSTHKRKHDTHAPRKQLTDEDPSEKCHSTLSQDGTFRLSMIKGKKTQPGSVQYPPAARRIDGTLLGHVPFGRVEQVSDLTTDEVGFTQRKRMDNIIRTNPEVQLSLANLGHPPPLVPKWSKLTMLTERGNRHKLQSNKNPNLDNDKNQALQDLNTRISTAISWIHSDPSIQSKNKGPANLRSASSHYDETKGKKPLDHSQAETQKTPYTNFTTSRLKFGNTIPSGSESIKQSPCLTPEGTGLPKIANSVLRPDSFELYAVEPWFKRNTESTMVVSRHISIYASLEILGAEIVEKINFVPKNPTSQNSLQLTKYRACAESHAIKAIVTYIDVINRISEPLWFPSAEQLKTAQIKAIEYVENIWEKLNQPREPRLQANSGVSSSLPPLDEEERVLDLLHKDNFNARASNLVSELCFLMWLRKAIPQVHLHVHLEEFPFHWKRNIISILRKYVLTLKSSEEITNALKSVDKSRAYEGETFFTYNLEKSFKIEWKLN